MQDEGKQNGAQTVAVLKVGLEEAVKVAETVVSALRPHVSADGAAEILRRLKLRLDKPEASLCACFGCAETATATGPNGEQLCAGHQRRLANDAWRPSHSWAI